MTEYVNIILNEQDYNGRQRRVVFSGPLIHQKSDAKQDYQIHHDGRRSRFGKGKGISFIW